MHEHTITTVKPPFSVLVIHEKIQVEKAAVTDPGTITVHPNPGVLFLVSLLP